MAIKGSATIELTNADGSKEVIKHDNMITNAVNDLCVSQRGEMSAILKVVKNNDSYAQSMFGGLLLFGDTLNSDDKDYFIPTANIVGYASQDAYAGLDIARGSFNASEGGVQEDGSYKFVWDFSTSQANGTIKSLALCPNMMGQIGASETIQNGERKDFYITNDVQAPFGTYGRMLPDNGETAGISNYNFNIVAIVGDVAYAFEECNIRYNYRTPDRDRFVLNNGNILKLYKFKLGANSISLADRVGMARYLGCEDVVLPEDFVSELYKSDGNCAISYFYIYDTSTLIMYPCFKKAAISVHGTTKIMELNITNMQTSVQTFTNNTGGEIKVSGTAHNAANGNENTMFVCKDYVVSFGVDSSSTGMYVTSRADNTNVKQVKYSDDNLFTFNTTSSIVFAPMYVCKNILIFKYRDSTSSYYLLDMDTGIIKKTNAKNMSSSNMVDIGSKVVYARCDAYASYRFMINPFILTTKNNLDAPVTKTASQTMKITYTLSEMA